MSTELDTKIMEECRKALPGMLADALQKELEAGRQAIKDVARLTNELQVARERNADLSEQNSKLSAGEASVRSRESAVSVREAKMAEVETELRIAGIRLDCEKEKTGLVQHMFSQVFRNTEVRRSLHTTEHVPTFASTYTNGGSSYAQSGVVPAPRTETATEHID